jgi:hypothetical protein
MLRKLRVLGGSLGGVAPDPRQQEIGRGTPSEGRSIGFPGVTLGDLARALIPKRIKARQRIGRSWN